MGEKKIAYEFRWICDLIEMTLNTIFKHQLEIYSLL